MPAARRCFAVPTVDSNFTFNSRKARAKSARPVLSETLNRAHRMGIKSTSIGRLLFARKRHILYEASFDGKKIWLRSDPSGFPWPDELWEAPLKEEFKRFIHHGGTGGEKKIGICKNAPSVL